MNIPFSCFIFFNLKIFGELVISFNLALTPLVMLFRLWEMRFLGSYICLVPLNKKEILKLFRFTPGEPIFGRNKLLDFKEF